MAKFLPRIIVPFFSYKVCEQKGPYSISLSKAIKDLSFNRWDDERWLEAAKEVTPEVLDGLTPLIDPLQTKFEAVDLQVRIKPLKRVLEQIERETRPPIRERDVQSPKDYFKIVSDLLRGQVPCEVPEITSKLEKIEEIVKAEGGFVGYRSNFTDMERTHLTKGQYVGMSQIAYGYLPEYGHIIEFRVGHPLVLYSVSQETLSDDPLLLTSFYQQAQEYILNKANGDLVSTRSLTLLKIKAKEAYGGEVPAPLKEILENL